MDETLIVVVGPANEEFQVPTKRVLEVSPMLYDTFSYLLAQEDCDGKVTLEDDSPAAFARFHAWLHCRSIFRVYEFEIRDGNLSFDTREWIQLYLFAAKYYIVALQNTVMDKLMAGRNRISFTARECAVIYEGPLPHGCKLQRFVMNWWLKRARKEDVTLQLIEMAPELVRSVIVVLLEQNPARNEPWAVNRVSYHD
ncbi:hypothetical protein CAC42_1598 [Sphaceloma murrayae]|uniref:BTB domain-containing protein n=1 Tax=Sphaceloma murrayae TaxID=2082308 RepID=A0A2K1R371_9PEZI|nr:hypothetical protein CAC42_1598 [Sphaceloma murrayae]